MLAIEELGPKKLTNELKVSPFVFLCDSVPKTTGHHAKLITEKKRKPNQIPPSLSSALLSPTHSDNNNSSYVKFLIVFFLLQNVTTILSLP